MNLKIMRLVLRMQYSTIPAAPPPGQLDGVLLTVDRVPQIPRRTPGSRLRRGLTYHDGLRLDLLLPVTAGPYPLVVYVPGGGFVVAPRRMARRQRAYVAGRMRETFTNPRHPIQRYGAVDANPADLVHPAASPFLLLHGDDDRIVAPDQTGLLHRALVGAGADSTRYVLAGAGHGQLSLTRRQAEQWTSVQVLTTIKNFLDQQLRS